jgi:uncharacterized protein YpuA (DUF1002 family)
MTQLTDTDLQQLKDLISDVNKNVEVGFARTDERLKAIEGQLTDIRARTNQQSIWLFTLLLMLLGTAFTAVARLTKIY